jgi:hypothetical protein
MDFEPSGSGGTRLTLNRGKYSEKDSELRRATLGDGFVVVVSVIDVQVFSV